MTALRQAEKAEHDAIAAASDKAWHRASRDDAVRDCDCCGERKRGVRMVDSPSMGETWACAKCMGQEDEEPGDCVPCEGSGVVLPSAAYPHDCDACGGTGRVRG